MQPNKPVSIYPSFVAAESKSPTLPDVVLDLKVQVQRLKEALKKAEIERDLLRSIIERR